MRLDKMLSNSGYGTRSDVTKAIRKGKITVNGVVIKDNGFHVTENDDIVFDGESAVSKSHLYFMMDKPDGVLTAMEDKRLPTIADYIPASISNLKLSPVGRLDYHTTGLLIITNDGELSHRLTSPKYEVPKEYLVTYSGHELGQEQIDEAASGMTLTDMDKPVKLAPAKLEVLSNNKAILTLTEGKTHEVRRMISSWGCEVVELRRISIGNIKLPEDSLPGALIELTSDQIDSLKKSTNL